MVFGRTKNIPWDGFPYVFGRFQKFRKPSRNLPTSFPRTSRGMSVLLGTRASDASRRQWPFFVLRATLPLQGEKLSDSMVLSAGRITAFEARLGRNLLPESPATRGSGAGMGSARAPVRLPAFSFPTTIFFYLWNHLFPNCFKYYYSCTHRS